MDNSFDYKDFRFPAEFETQEAVWLGWPVYENKKGLSSIPGGTRVKFAGKVVSAGRLRR
jgi:agmatine/peptidylarginine deiminase